MRSGFEVAYFTPELDRLKIEGTAAGLQNGLAWVVSYEVRVDQLWRTREAAITTRTSSGSIERNIKTDGAGQWLVDGHKAHHLDGCLDLDLESSAMTNMLPIHRLRLAEGERAAAPAAYVRLPDGHVERLDQTYTRIESRQAGPRYDYNAPAFDFRAQLVYDQAGLVLDYPGIAVRLG